MTEDTIHTKYEQLKPPSSCSSHDKPTPIVMHNFFSTKKFATTVSSSEHQHMNVNICDAEPIIIIDQTDTSTTFKNNSSSQGNIRQFF
jgi:hypothetical protein